LSAHTYAGKLRGAVTPMFQKPSHGYSFSKTQLVRWGLVLAVPLTVFLLLFCLCRFDAAIPYLSSLDVGEWIIDPRPFSGGRHSPERLATVFQRAFIVPELHPPMRLRFRAFRSCVVSVNDAPVSLTPSDDRDWKSVTELDVTGLVQQGTNVLRVSVVNDFGPPALWLRLEAASSLICGTDESWKIVSEDSNYYPAQLARSSLDPVGIDTGNNGLTSTETRLLRFFLILVSCVFLVLLVRNVLIKHPAWQNWSIPVLFIFIILVRATLLLHNASLLSRDAGFDAKGHKEYVSFILEKGRLPLPSDGWEMHQPPLYYFFGAMLLKGLNVAANDEVAISVLRSFNWFIGLLTIWLVLLCLRRLFPLDVGAQAFGLLVASFLPCQIYLSQYITNDPLACLLATLAVYTFLRFAPACDLKSTVLIGAILGAALLTKLNVLLILPLFPLALMLYARPNSINEKGCQVGTEGRPSLGWHWQGTYLALTMLCSIFLVSGWNFIRVGVISNQPILGNWDAPSKFAWWQDPGFRLADFYTHFGRSLKSPLFSGLYSFGDGLFSTVWADGLASGAASPTFRQPWNYEYMSVSCALGLVLTALALLGIAISTATFVRKPAPELLVILGMLFFTMSGVVWLSLRVASPASVKGFYALPALIPFCAVIGVGWRRLSKLNTKLNIGLWTILTVWTVITCIGFWINPRDPQIYFMRGLEALSQKKPDVAKVNLERALQLDQQSTFLTSSRAQAHLTLGMIEESANHGERAMLHYREAIRAQETCDPALNNLAWLLATTPGSSDVEAAEAVLFSEKACKLTHYKITTYIGTLAAAYAKAGRFQEATDTAENAAHVADLRNEHSLAARNRELSALFRSGKVFVSTTGQ